MYEDPIKTIVLHENRLHQWCHLAKRQKYDIATPYCAFLTQLVHAKEGILGGRIKAL